LLLVSPAQSFLVSGPIGGRNQEHHVKHVNRLCAQNVRVLHFKAGGTHSNHCLIGLNTDVLLGTVYFNISKLSARILPESYNFGKLFHLL
jgi:hypothetical protein